MRPARSPYLWILLIVFGTGAARVSAQEFPILPALTAEELALKDAPALASGAAAIVLYYGVETDNAKSRETQALRIKVLRDEGKKYANIEIPYWEKYVRVEGLRARVVGPDGKATESGDPIYEREIVKAKKLRMNAKVMTLSNVQVGSIIEYSYTLQYKDKIPDIFRNPSKYIYTRGFTYPAARWTLQRDLFVRHAHFTLLRVTGVEIRQHFVAFPSNAMVRTLSDGNMQLDMENIPPYEEEEYSLPEENLKMQVNLYYATGFYSPEAYWTGLGRYHADEVDKFIGKSKVIESEAGRLTNATDSDEEKLRKIYARVQQIRAVSYEGTKTEKEIKRENLKENKSAEDVLKRGYAYANQINLLFVALARAAKIPAYPILIASRRNVIFLSDLPDGEQLNAMVVQARLGTKFVHLDPATKFCPYGLIPWEETETEGVRVDRFHPEMGIAQHSKSTDAVTQRNADLHLKEDGEIEGTVEMQYFGQEALSMRLSGSMQDEADRRKELEESIRKSLVQGAAVNLKSTTGWDSSEGPLKASFSVAIPNYATKAGRRLLLPAGIFHANQSNPFFAARRVHPLYFSYPQESHEEVKLEVPKDMQVESLPAARKSDQRDVYYEFSVAKDGNTLRFSRTFRLSGFLFDAKQYPIIKAFYDRMLFCDTQQLTLIPRAESTSR